MMMMFSSTLKRPDWPGARNGTHGRVGARKGDFLERCHTTTVRDYWLYDQSGQRIGTISAAERQPTVGTNAPTFYLQRSLTP